MRVFPQKEITEAAEEFFELCLKVFSYSFNFLWVLTDNGSEFKKHFAEKLKELHLTHSTEDSLII